MGIVPGEPTHVAEVTVFDGGMIKMGERVRYEGPANWKYRPLDREAAAEWEREIADPRRTLQTNLQRKDVLVPPLSPAEKAWQEDLRRQRGTPIRIA